MKESINFDRIADRYDATRGGTERGRRLAAGVDIVPTGPYPVATVATTVADNIEGRTHSWTWSVPDDVWDRYARVAIAKLRALPNAAEPVWRNEYQEILVLER